MASTTQLRRPSEGAPVKHQDYKEGSLGACRGSDDSPWVLLGSSAFVVSSEYCRVDHVCVWSIRAQEDGMISVSASRDETERLKTFRPFQIFADQASAKRQLLDSLVTRLRHLDDQILVLMKHKMDTWEAIAFLGKLP